MNVISVENVTKNYGKGPNLIKALNKISFQVPEGSIYGFIGPNGAGKSTTIGIILQFLFQEAGKVRLFDQDVNNKSFPYLKKQIGFIPDAELPRIPGVKILKHTGYYHNLQGKRLRDTLIEVTEITGTRSFIKRNTKKLSKGQKSRIKIANALIGNPALLIADEPTSGLDPVARRQFLNLISQLREEKGTTVFFSNHVIGEVEKICDKVAIISNGNIVANGTISSIIKRLPVKHRYNIIVQNCSLEELNQLPGIKNIEQKSQTEFVIETNDTNIEVPEFIKKLVHKKIILDSFVRENINLEDVFLSIVDK